MHLTSSVPTRLSLSLEHSNRIIWNYTVEGLRLLKVIVVQGKKLVIWEFMSNDFFFFFCGQAGESAKTGVINNCSNTLWNEELNFS
ncbi:hypothetical protein S83_038267 [Arachis hypogaea]